MSLTGRTRHREVRKWGKTLLVLQVEEKLSEVVSAGGYIDIDNYSRWRDAKVTDLATISLSIYKANDNAH